MGYENDVLVRPPPDVRLQFPEEEFISARGPDTHENRARRSGSWTDIGFLTAPSIWLKIALLAPIPSPAKGQQRP
jgi:hypothetical protein